MRRQEQQLERPATGYLPLSLFNQRKRNRIPLKSVPGENEFFSPSIEYMASTSSAASVGPSATYGCYQASDYSPSAPQSQQWHGKGVPESAKPQQYGNRSAPGPSTTRSYAPIAHPYKAGAKSSMTSQSSNPAGQWVSNSGVSPGHSQIQHPYGKNNPQSKPAPHAGFSQTAQQSSNKQTFPARQFSQQSRPLPPPEAPPPSMPPAQATQQPTKSWTFTNSFEHQKSNFIAKNSSNQPPTAKATKKEKESVPAKQPMENSLRILTTVISGMRHWSQFKDKIPYLFEIFATLDSAVTLGRYGAKSFLMRDGKDVLQCVFYENEQLLPRLIRGQVHRCIGNYDRSRDVLMCVSVRAAQPSEQRNALEAVKVSDAEMRALVKMLSEV